MMQGEENSFSYYLHELVSAFVSSNSSFSHLQNELLAYEEEKNDTVACLQEEYICYLENRSELPANVTSELAQYFNIARDTFPQQLLDDLLLLSYNNDFVAVKAYSLGELWDSEWTTNNPRNFTLHPDCDCSYEDNNSGNPLQKSMSGANKDNHLVETNATETIQINIFPNPARNTVFISLDKLSGSSVKYQVYDIQGKELKSGNFSGQQQELNISNLSKGIYFISVTVENQSKITKKMVKE